MHILDKFKAQNAICQGRTIFFSVKYFPPLDLIHIPRYS